MIEITGYHGTRKEARSLILRKHFIPSRGENHWLGQGAYFFQDGCSAGVDDAKKWAAVQAWDKNSARNKYDRYVVLRAVIRLEKGKLLDLATDDGLQVFNEARGVIYERFGLSSYHNKSADAAIVDFLAEKLGFQVIRARFFIKLSADERKIMIRPA